MQCKSSFGQEVSSGAIKLFKYAIRPKLAMQPLPASILSLVIGNELIRFSQAHATRHFLLEDEEESHGHLHLWLFLEFFEVSLKLPSPLTISGIDRMKHITSVSFSACKVMYRRATVQESSDSSSTSQAWAQPELVEHIQYPKQVCLELKQLLEHSTLTYPPSRRQFAAADWTVGFLQTAMPTKAK